MPTIHIRVLNILVPKSLEPNNIFNHYSTLSFQFARRVSNKFEKFADSKVVFMLWSTMKPCLTLHYCKWWNQDCIYDFNTVLFRYVLVTTSTSQMKNFILLLTYFRHQFELQMSFTQIVTHCLLLCMFTTKVGKQQTNTNHLVPFFVFYYILYQSKYVVFGFFFFSFFKIQCLIVFHFWF